MCRRMCWRDWKWIVFVLLAGQAVGVVLYYRVRSTHATVPSIPTKVSTIDIQIPRAVVDVNYSFSVDGKLRGRFPDLTQLYPVQRINAPHLPRALKPEVYNMTMLLLSLTVKVLEEHHVDYVLAYGSLIGSYLMHDLLPWDDDIDIFIHNDSKARVIELFQNSSHYGITGYHYVKSPAQIVKIFFKDSPPAGKYIWKYPYLDVMCYAERGNDIILVHREKKKFKVPKSSFYPFHKRPFGPLWLNAPRDPAVFLRENYGSFACETGVWNHMKERREKTIKSACDKLTPYYPFVKREKHGNMTAETLVFSDVALYKIYVDEPYHAPETMFEF